MKWFYINVLRSTDFNNDILNTEKTLILLNRFSSYVLNFLIFLMKNEPIFTLTTLFDIDLNILLKIFNNIDLRIFLFELETFICYVFFLVAVVTFNSFQKKCFQLPYLLSIFSDINDFFNIFLIRFLDLFNSSRFKDTWLFSFFLIFCLIRLLTVNVKTIFFLKSIFFVKHNDWFVIICFSFIIDCYGCVELKSITQLHFSIVNIFFSQFMSELCNFNQSISKMILWMIILTISKINAFW